VAIDPTGRIESPVVGGAEAIRTLVHRAAGQAPQVAISNAGLEVPDLLLERLDQTPVRLRELFEGRERKLALFWNPGCGFCRKMLPDLLAYESLAPADRHLLVLISRGDPERIREHGLRSPVVLDPDGSVARAFAAGGTPTGLLVSDARVVSPLARGAEAVMRLAGATPTAGRVGAASANASL
jgi:thiol-disulfide isomerase/thioredoxin